MATNASLLSLIHLQPPPPPKKNIYVKKNQNITCRATRKVEMLTPAGCSDVTKFLAKLKIKETLHSSI